MLLNSVPEEAELDGSGLPDTPMFRQSERLRKPSNQESSQFVKQDNPQLSSAGSLHFPESLDCEQESEKTGLYRLNSLSTDKTTMAESSSMIGRSKSAVDISPERNELERLRKTNSHNERIIWEVTSLVKQLQSKVDCYELCNGELRLQLL